MTGRTGAGESEVVNSVWEARGSRHDGHLSRFSIFLVDYHQILESEEVMGWSCQLTNHISSGKTWIVLFVDGTR
jgi:hypothetical protein